MGTLAPPAAPLSATEGELLQQIVRGLAAIDRPSASAGERRAAEWIAGRLRELGCHTAVECERAHGGYWWPLGLASGVAALAGLAAWRGRRRLGLATALAAACAVREEVGDGALRLRRRLPQRSTFNVVARTGDRTAARTVVVVAHHDAAHSGLIFHPALPAFVAARFPGIVARAHGTPPVMHVVLAGPALVAAGALTGRRWTTGLGAALALATAGCLVDIARRPAVPGANDNASGVAALVALARALRENPVQGTGVLLVSTGSEESFMEGMRAFGRRHFAALRPEHTHVICVDSVGSPRLGQASGEGMLVLRRYPTDFCTLVAECAAAAGIDLIPPMNARLTTDALVALRAGYPATLIASVDPATKLPSNYHWPTDTPANVDYGTIAAAARLCEAVIRSLAA
jgi:hypothetical protein